MYGFKEMSDLAKLASRHLKAKFGLNLVRITMKYYKLWFLRKIISMRFMENQNS